MVKIQILQHVPFEGPANIEKWAKSKNHEICLVECWKEIPKEINNSDLLIVLGGPMGAYDDEEFPWLRQEKKFIKEQILKGQKVLGICLGAQLIAEVLDARVYSNKLKEIGCFPITLSQAALEKDLFKDFPEKPEVLHWHGDTFELPPKSQHLAFSEACTNQAFSWNDRVFGFQFHLESNKESIQLLLDNCSDELMDGEFIQNPEQMLKLFSENAKALEIYLNSFLDKLIEMKN